MKIFFICNKSPWPHHEGGPIAMNRLIEGMLRRGHEVKVLAINSHKYHVNPEDVPEEYRKKTGLELHYLDLAIKPWPAFMNLFTSKSYHVERFISESFRKRVIRILDEHEFDIVQMEMLYIAPYIDTIRKYSGAPVILRAHNIEHEIWDRVRETTRNPLKKWYLRHITHTLKSYEINVLPRFDGIAAITGRDANALEKYVPNNKITDIPFGIYPEQYEISNPDEWNFPSLFHIGSMNWMPNEEGIKWFIDNVWPLIRNNHPDVKLYLAGRHMPDWLKKLNVQNIEIVGEVESAGGFINSMGVMIVPLLSGSGIRIKIIEGMAAAKPIVSTTVGAEGINCTSGKDILLADSPEEFSDAVSELLKNKEKAVRMGAEARKLIEKAYNNDKIAARLEEFYRKIITEKASS